MQIRADRINRWTEAGGSVVSLIGGGLADLYYKDVPVPGPLDCNGCRFFKGPKWVDLDTFIEATHPPVPEGWEKVGEWRPIGATYDGDSADGLFLDDGRVVEIYLGYPGVAYFCPIKKKAPPVPVTKDGIPVWVGIVAIDPTANVKVIVIGFTPEKLYTSQGTYSSDTFAERCTINLEHEPTALMLGMMCARLLNEDSRRQGLSDGERYFRLTPDGDVVRMAKNRVVALWTKEQFMELYHSLTKPQA